MNEYTITLLVDEKMDQEELIRMGNRIADQAPGRNVSWQVAVDGKVVARDHRTPETPILARTRTAFGWLD